MSNNSTLSHSTTLASDSDHEEHESVANATSEKRLLRKKNVGWLTVDAMPSASDTARVSDDGCCINIDPNLSAAVGHQKSLPSFYIERLLGFGTDHASSTVAGCHSKQDPIMETLLNVSNRRTGEKSTASTGTPASLCSTPPSGSAISIVSEREWCGGASSSLAALSPIGSPPPEQTIPGSAPVSGSQSPYSSRSCLTSIVYNQPAQQSMPGRKVNTVYIAWPEGRTLEVNLNRFQRTVLSHGGGTHDLAAYGKWPPEPGPGHLLQERVSHKPNHAKLNISGDPYIHLQASTLKRYRKQNRERKPRQAYSAMQLERLEDEFQRNIYLNVNKRFELAQCLGLTETQIKTWFQNRRTKFKKQQDSRNKREQRQQAQLIAQWLFQPQQISTIPLDGQFQPVSRLPVLPTHRSSLALAQSTLQSALMAPYHLLPPASLTVPLSQQSQQQRALDKASRIVAPGYTVRSPNGAPVHPAVAPFTTCMIPLRTASKEPGELSAKGPTPTIAPDENDNVQC